MSFLRSASSPIGLRFRPHPATHGRPCITISSTPGCFNAHASSPCRAGRAGCPVGRRRADCRGEARPFRRTSAFASAPHPFEFAFEQLFETFIARHGSALPMRNEFILPEPAQSSKWDPKPTANAGIHSESPRLRYHINHKFVYYVIDESQIRSETRRNHDSQNTAFYSRTNAAASGGAICHGRGRHAPPHGGVPRPLPKGAGAAQGLCGHQERCAAAGLLGHGRDGGVGLESDLAGRQGAGADGGQVWRALDGPGEGVWLRAGCGDRSLWRRPSIWRK